MYATQQLRNEHEVIQRALSVLEEMAGELNAGKAVEREHLTRIVDFLRTFADKCHHGKEEDQLFPALAAVGIPTQGGPIGVMLFEHTQGRGYIAAMAEALGQMEAGEDAGRAFAHNATCYAGLLRSHIDKENHVLFVMAEQHLSDAEHARLTGAFAQVEERVGAEAHAQYPRLIEELTRVYLKTAA